MTSAHKSAYGLSKDRLEETKTKEARANRAYWDDLDSISEGFIKSLIAMSQVPKEVSEDDVLLLSKEFLSEAIKALELRGLNYPFINQSF